MGTTLHWPALITLATLLLLFGCAWLVGAARARHKVRAPALRPARKNSSAHSACR